MELIFRPYFGTLKASIRGIQRLGGEIILTTLNSTIAQTSEPPKNPGGP